VPQTEREDRKLSQKLNLEPQANKLTEMKMPMLVSHVALGVYQTNGWLVTVHAPLCLSLATSKAMTPRGLDYHDHEKEDHDPEKPCPTNKNETELLACTLSEDVD